MEFIKGITLDCINSVTAEKFLNPNSELGTSILKELGSIMAIDILLNNWFIKYNFNLIKLKLISDRFPLIWSDEGNLDNIIISELGHAFAIDSKCIPLDKEKSKSKKLKYE